MEEEQKEKQSFKESLKEILVVIKVCLTSFWFWLPPLFAIFLFIEIYFLFVNPLLFIIGPTIIVIYALMWEEKRLKAKKIEALEETEQSTEEGEEEQEIVFEEIIVDTGKEGEKLKELDDDGFEELERNYVNKWIQKKLQEAKGKGLKAKKTEMLEKIEQPTVEEQEQSIEEREEDQEIEFEEITVDTGEEEEELKQLDDELLKQLENKLKFDD